MDISISGSVITGLLTGGIAIVGNLLISARASGKTEGAIQTALKDIGSRLDRNDEDQQSQWSKIHEHTADIGYLKGRVNGGANGKAHHSGPPA